MEFQQKGQQLLSRRALFYEDRWGGELQWEKNMVELTFMVKAFTQNGGNYCAYELLLQKKCCFHFLIRTTTKTPFMVICHTSKQRIGFGQLTWDKEINNHDLLLGPPLPILR
jgi:outer membrane receptor for ferrienterochelin and colicins